MSDTKASQSDSVLLQSLKLIGKLWMIVTAVIGSLFVLGIVSIIFFFHHSSSELAQEPSHKILRQGGSDKVAVVHLNGEIVENNDNVGLGSATQTVTAKETTQLLEDLSKDTAIKAVVLVIDSPGGAVVASDEIYQSVKKLRAVKPVVVQMVDVAASGGYYIAAGANKIVANPATITGSIGVIAQFPQLAGLYNKLGVQMRTIKSGQFKDIGSSNRDFTPEEEKILNTMITEAYNQFVAAISQGRQMDELQVRQLADGRIYTGKQAKENGLVDQLGGFDDAAQVAQDLAHISNPTLIEYSSQSFWASLFSAQVNSILPLSSLQHLVPSEKTGMYYLLQI